MPKSLIKKWMPHNDTIRRHKSLRLLGRLLEVQGLWHLNRRSVSGAVAVGLFIAWVQLPFQMILSALAAFLFHVNLPISVVLVWITNPLTMPPMFYFAYHLGAGLLDIPDTNINFELSWEWLANSLVQIWQPFLIGCFVLGVISSLVGYILMRLVWRWHVVQSWRRRHKNRKART